MEMMLAGIVLGFIGGIAPGPILPLLVSTSLDKGFRAGTRIAVAPLITDLPIMFTVLLLLTYLPASALRWLGMVGGLVIIFVGLRMFRQGGESRRKGREAGRENGVKELGKGVMINFLSLSAWVFWLVIGGPFFTHSWHRGFLTAAFFLLGYFGLNIGIKIVIAWIVSSKRKAIGGSWSGRVIRICGLALIVAGSVLSWQALEGNFEKLIQRPPEITLD